MARTGPLPLALQSASVSESLMMTSSYGTGYVVNTDDIMGGGECEEHQKTSQYDHSY